MGDGDEHPEHPDHSDHSDHSDPPDHGEHGDDPAPRLLRAAYVVGREVMAPLQASGAAGHHLQRLRVLLATLGAHLEATDGAWLSALRSLEADLHRLALDRLQGRVEADADAEAALASERARRLREALRAADRSTYGARVVDLFGASLLTGLGRAEVRAAIERGELAADDDGRGPLIALDALAALAAARGWPWRDGLEDEAAGAEADAEVAALVGPRQGDSPE